MAAHSARAAHRGTEAVAAEANYGTVNRAHAAGYGAVQHPIRVAIIGLVATSIAALTDAAGGYSPFFSVSDTNESRSVHGQAGAAAPVTGIRARGALTLQSEPR